MEKPGLNDPAVYPDDSVLARHLGRAKSAWDAMVEEVAQNPALELVDWKFYRDGKVWLTRVVNKKKTLCWISVWPKYFKATFYFTHASPAIMEATSAIHDSIKKQWQKDNQGKKYRGITVVTEKKSDVTLISRMLDIKAACK